MMACVGGVGSALLRLGGAAALALLVACGEPRSTPPQAVDGRPRVLTTFTVLADMARQVAGDRLDVQSITRIGAEVHGYEPTPSDMERAAGADLIVENGFGLERWAKRYIASAGDVPTVTLSQGMEPLLIASDAAAGQANPHAWMSPKRAQVYVDRLVDAFSQLDPEGQTTYQQNGAAYKQRLQALDQELRVALATIPPKQRVLVSCEGAFSYLAHDYGLEEAYLWPVNAESQITPRRMVQLIETVRSRQVPVVFCETTVSDKAQREVARASGARFGGSFYVDSLSEPGGPAPTLIDLQRHNVKLLLDGLKGSDLPG
ncbi:Manganese ABC transporter periplasmic-binding protein SitA [Synechococcus sp. WH 8101]|nr:metal ABC transporter substrate-binding protein [Synechococcus sp. WH 8101]QBE69368.1 Manganese ABC transporter periplasmic-binding protein SitA [Synechococcus sp. WH 8101]QNI45613.1 ABC-type Mn2+ transporter/ substrate binding protein [Synechococcus sp. WH 8101]